MSVFNHLVIFVSYVAIAAAVGVALPDYVPLEPEAARWAGIGMLVVGVQAQLLFSWLGYRRVLLDRVDGVAHEVKRVAALAELNAEDIVALSDQMNAGDAESERLISELKMVQTLLTQVVARSGPAEADGGKAPAKRGRSRQTSKPATGEAQDQFHDIVRNALADNRVDLYLQPIVGLPNRRSRHYECFSRVRDETGQVIFPSDYLPVAASAGLMGTLDNLLLVRCIQLVRRLGQRRRGVRLFCNISSASLHDGEFFPQFIDYMSSNRGFADRLVFEFSQADVASLSGEVAGSLAALARQGYQFSMDQITHKDFELAALAELGVRFVKIDHDLLIADQGDIHPRDLKEVLARHDMTLIGARVEAEDTVIDLLDHNVEFAQGYLFGEPRPAREGPRREAQAVEALPAS